MQGNVLKKVRSERESGESSEDEVVDVAVEALQTVELRQLLQVQVVFLAHLPLQVLAAEVHRAPQLEIKNKAGSE